MPEATSGPRFRYFVWLAPAILGLFALAGPADASLCHAPERPTFGMDDAPIGVGQSALIDPELTVPASPHYDESPCPADSAGFPSKLSIPRAPLSAPFRVEPDDSRRFRRPKCTLTRLPLADARPLERPPRDPFASFPN